MRLEVNFLHFLTLLGVKIWKIVHMICVESEFDDFAKGSGQMKVIGKIIILLSFIFNSLSPALVYASEDNPVFNQSEISEVDSAETYKNDLSESSVSKDTIGSEELTADPTIQGSEEKIDTATENTDSSIQVSESDEETISTELDSVDLIDSSGSEQLDSTVIDSTNSEIVEADSSIKMQESGAISNQPEAGAMLAEEVATPSVSYQTHVQNYGWTSVVKDGMTSGTIGEAKRLEGIKISLATAPVTGGIEYQTHVENIGWMNTVSDGKVSGTTGESKRLEAIRINLTGDMAGSYDIYYRVHSQNFGWLGWAKNGESAGTSGYGYRLEAIEIQLVQKEGIAPSPTVKAYMEKEAGVSYSTHVQSFGWQNYVADGALSGTTGESKQVEAIKIKGTNFSLSGSVTYRAHVQDVGWQNWMGSDALSGTVGMGKRLEAIEVNLTGEMAARYDIYYRVHVQKFGWLGWAKNGESAGTEAYSYRIEAIEIKLVEEGGPAPGSTANRFILREEPILSYSSHVQNVGWQNYVFDGALSGTLGESKRLEALKVRLDSQPYEGAIAYSANVQGSGWQTWSQNDALTGTTGTGKYLEAFKIKLTGEMAEYYDIYYRVHTQNYGWLDWAKNGAVAGTEGYGYRIEAVQIKILSKGKTAPGNTTRPFVKKPSFVLGPNWTVEQGYFQTTSGTRYYVGGSYIIVSIAQQKMWSYIGTQKIVETDIITGNPYLGYATPKGLFAIQGKQSPSVLIGPGYASPVQYWLPFLGNSYGIHDSSWQTHGYGGDVYLTYGSHGCVNTPLAAVRTLFYTYSVGTPVVIY